MTGMASAKWCLNHSNDLVIEPRTPRCWLLSWCHRHEPFLGAEFLIKIIVFWFWICRGAKYQNITKIPKCTWGSKYQNNGCIEADFYENFAIFRHFSRSFRKNKRKLLKTSEIVENLRTKFWKFWKIRCILIFWCILAIWYFRVFCTLILKFSTFCSQTSAHGALPAYQRRS